MNFSVTLSEITKGIEDVKKMFTTSGPGLPVADVDMVIEADANYTQGALVRHPKPRRLEISETPPSTDPPSASSPPPNHAVAKLEAETPEEHAAHDAARFRLAWALAHSRREGDAKRAVALLQEGAYDWADAVAARDRRYIAAVAHYNDGDFLAARAAAEEALKFDAGCRQAETLRAAAEDAIARDGIIGIGAVGVGAAVLGGLVTALATTRRR